jgi:phosphoribosyl-ATP pyrophosphohydrolase
MREAPRNGTRTAKLMREGTVKMAKKLAEEAVEVGHEAILKDRACVIAESADLLYNLVVLWADAGVTPREVWAEMERRRALVGLAEKLPKVAAR